MDDAGDGAADAIWRPLAADKCRRLLIPHGKDIGEFVQAGGDPVGLLRSEAARLGITL